METIKIIPFTSNWQFFELKGPFSTENGSGPIRMYAK
jgi:hypothetical protein